ncbi:uncharacterized protein LOC116177141 [Photinus pyralis]|nr:uncharacterized protein LOC116167285 [Photinus pyralis]XP_031347072.1 uncharacterized protein LOC116173593 [Photinus pyralis]XP_031348148.1 uncharacterized protein LOC116174375 [Photinus pyralis]XP_031351882.1 uncharacterized protein LOC116177141 [Photinus pyralis]
MDEVPESIQNKANLAADQLIPHKSKSLYNLEYSKFVKWLANNGTGIINEVVLLAHFQELSEVFQPTSLWTKFSMIKKTLLLNKNVNIGNYAKLTQFLKNVSKGHVSKKSSVLTREDILKFLRQAPNHEYLLVKVALIFGIYGGCRRQELCDMLISDVEDRGEVIVVTIPQTKTDK